MNLARKLIEMDRKSPKRILVVGDVMTDVYIYGRVEDTCQEGCPKFIEENRVSVPGGAANAAESLKHWRSKVMRGPLDLRVNLLSIKTRFMTGGRCILRHDRDQTIHEVDRRSIHAEALSYLHIASDAILLSDYDKGVLTPEFIMAVADICRSKGKPCVADCKRAPEVYAGCILKGNGHYWGSYPLNRNSITTYGPLLPHDCHGPIGEPLPPVECVNHVGAGDCFAAHLTLAIVHGFTLKEAAAVAHSAGRVYVQHPHNRPPRPEEIAADMDLAAQPARC